VFQRVGRGLALLNALVVIVIIVTTGAVTYAALSRSLNREVDDALKDQIEAFDFSAALSSPTVATPTRKSDDDDDDKDEHDDHDHRVVISGDTIVIAVNAAGEVIANPRDLRDTDIPVRTSIAEALGGDRDVRTVRLDDAGSVRVMTIPIEEDDTVIGAVQAIRSLREHQDELTLVRWISILGAGLGILIAIPAGLYLAQRAMRPINAAFQRQRAFVADASHELRTPLTLIRANADYALMDVTRQVADVHNELASILTEVDRTNRLVDGLLILARADADRIQLALQSADVSKIARGTVQQMQPMFTEKGVELNLSTGDTASARVDPERITQVLRILLDNALKHTPPAGSVDLHVAVVGQDVEVRIRDTGTGIGPEDLPHVFDRFYRADPSRTRTTGGTGLGLPIAKALIEAHDGQIQIESTPGSGTTATVTIPRSLT
jgi:signal transduction histidine kinase